MFFSLSTLLRVLVASASISFVAAQTTDTEITAITDELYAKISPNAAPPGFNVEGGSVFTNFARAFKDKQFFLLITASLLYEKPGSEPLTDVTLLYWCSQITSSDLSNSSTIGLAARCVDRLLVGYAEMVASGGQVIEVVLNGTFGASMGLSAVFVEQLNVFEVQLHQSSDDYVIRFWDDGRRKAPVIAWEGHDEGDMAANAATASFSCFGDVTFISVKELAQVLNTTVDDFSSEKFNQVYTNTWIKDHEFEAAEDNPNPEPELEIIEEVENEEDRGETTSTAEPNTEDGGSGTDPAAPIDDGSAGNGRKLVSATARFVSAALRVFVFGI